MKDYPLDIESVKKIGVKYWLENQINWPVNENVFYSMMKKIQTKYLVRATQLNEEEKIFYYASYKIYNDILMFSHSLLVLNELQKKQLTPFYMDKNWYYHDIMHNSKEVNGVIRKYSSKLYPAFPTNTLLIKYKMRSIYNNIRNKNIFNRLSNQALSIISKPREIFKEYLRSNLYYSKSIYPFRIYNNKIALTKNDHNLIQKLSQIFIDILEETLKEYQLNFSENHLSYYICEFNCFITRIVYLTRCIELYLLRKKSSPILVDSLGTTFSRCLSTAARLNNFPVIGAVHGNNFGIHRTISLAIIDLSLVDTYLTPASSAKKYYEKLVDLYIPRSKIEIINTNTGKYKNLIKTNRKKYQSNKQIESVMIVEYPLTELRHDNIFAYWPYQLNIMLRIMISVKNLGKKVYMKRHPDRLKESSLLYKDFCDGQLEEPFEKVYEFADALFFANITSTTFIFSLTTNKPILFLDILLKDVWPELHEPLKERCNVIPSWFDDNGQLQYDEFHLRDALNSKTFTDNKLTFELDSFLVDSQ